MFFDIIKEIWIITIIDFVAENLALPHFNKLIGFSKVRYCFKTE